MIRREANYVDPLVCAQYLTESLAHFTEALTGPAHNRQPSAARIAWNHKREMVGFRRLKLEPGERIERSEVVLYGPGGGYKTHHDGYQRHRTFLVPLNRGYVGGELHFPSLLQTLELVPGELISWYNDEHANHEAVPVRRGFKAISICWTVKDG